MSVVADTTMMTIATVACGVACAILVVSEARADRVGRIGAKIIASAAFVAVGALAAAAHDTAFARWVLAGLVLGAVGDVCLLGGSRRAFLAGLGAFLLGHLAYVFAIATALPPERWLGAAGALAAAPIIVGGIVLAWLWPRLGGMRAPVIAYVATIVAMVVGAFAAMRTGVAPTRLAAGAALFFASDIAVARNRFVARTFANRAWGLPAYYAAQLMIAWSI